MGRHGTRHFAHSPQDKNCLPKKPTNGQINSQNVSTGCSWKAITAAISEQNVRTTWCEAEASGFDQNLMFFKECSDGLFEGSF